LRAGSVDALSASIAGLALLVALHTWHVRRVGLRLRARLEARMQERERICCELHDDLLNSVTALSLQVRAAANQLPAESPLRSRLERVLLQTSIALSEPRDLGPGTGSSGSMRTLVDALSRLAQTISHEVPGLVIEVTSAGVAQSLRPGIHDKVYCMAQEGTFDALLHGRPTQLKIFVRFNSTSLELAVRVNGRCTDAARRLCSADSQAGTAALHDRARKIGAKLTFRPYRSDGIELLLEVPAETAYLPDTLPSRWSIRQQRSRPSK
jgi:signal transduction histidine kinase